MKAMRHKLKFLFAAVLLLSACESGPRVRMAPGYDQTATPVQSSANVMGTPAPTVIPPTPTFPPLALDDAYYTLPSQTFSFYPPIRWTLEGEDENFARFVSPDNSAWMEAAVESGGYELPADDFQVYVDNMVASLYSGTEDYQQLRREESGGKTLVTAAFMKGSQKWYSLEVFYQRGQAFYNLSFQAHELVWNVYRSTFLEIANTVVTRTGYLRADQIYIFRRSYQSPSGVFELTVPMGWSLARDVESIKDSIIETIASPDEEAVIEVIAFNDPARLAEVDIGQITVGLLNEHYGEDFRILTDGVVRDGRVRIDWDNPKTGTSGVTLFWISGRELIILTLSSAGSHPGTYQPVIDAVGDSFVFLKE